MAAQDIDQLTRRLCISMEGLNVRIARLASALHVALNDPIAMDVLMATRQTQPIVKERRTAHIDLAQVNVSADRRRSHLQEELRGLLVLRLQLEAASLNNNGLSVTLQAMAQAEEHLIRQGFEPGADGLDLDEFFKVS